jgi:DNA-binding NarL/FixJ family response regulator
MINIAIADDQVLFRKGIISLLNSFKNMQVLIEAENGEDLLDQLRTAGENIQVVLLDINMPIMNGIEAMKEIRTRYPQLKNIILTIHEEDTFINKLIEEGANAYLAKNSLPAELEKAIHTVVTHDYYFNENSIRAMHDHVQSRRKKITLQVADEVTAREKEIIQLVCREFTTTEIAQKLFISERTVDGHRNRLLAKTGCRNTAGLVLFSIKNNLFDLNEASDKRR